MKFDKDLLIVGAGFAGMYMLHKARASGLHAMCIEAGSSVGGTWYWNRYPGARCDVESLDYSYSFSEALQQEWDWSEKFATQPEILRYAEHVAERFDLKKDILFERRVTEADFDEETNGWTLMTDLGERMTARFVVLATGCLSAANIPDIQGLDSYTGKVLHTGQWPEEPVDFSGKRVGVIGTGSSGIQAIPLIAREAKTLTVFQRTPNYSLPANNAALDPQRVKARKAHYATYREAARWSRNGVPAAPAFRSALGVSQKERDAVYEKAWHSGIFGELENAYTDILRSEEANATASDFLKKKIRSKVEDADTAEKLLPHTLFATKRVCLDTGYFETFNNDNVSLVSLKDRPITRIAGEGLYVGQDFHALDCLVFATGFDAMTGAISRISIRGRDDQLLSEAWADGPQCYLGLCSNGFPNMFFVTGPGSPSVLSNMIVSIEQHVNWIVDLLAFMRMLQSSRIEATKRAQDEWVAHVNDLADLTLYPTGNSWYLGANIPGKKRLFMPYVGGVGEYRRKCNEIAEKGYCGFDLV